MKGRVGKAPPASLGKGHNIKASMEHTAKYSKFITSSTKRFQSLQRSFHTSGIRGPRRDLDGVMRELADKSFSAGKSLRMPSAFQHSTPMKVVVPSLNSFRATAVMAPASFASFVQTREASTLVKANTTDIVPKRNATTSTTAATVTRSADLYQKHFFEYSSMALLVSMPAPLLLSLPSAAAFGFDMVTAVVLPLHGYLGMKLVIDDYLPQAGVNGFATLLLILLTAVTVGGLFYVNVSGDGISGTIKQMWQKRIAEHK